MKNGVITQNVGVIDPFLKGQKETPGGFLSSGTGFTPFLIPHLSHQQEAQKRCPPQWAVAHELGEPLLKESQRDTFWGATPIAMNLTGVPCQLSWAHLLPLFTWLCLFLRKRTPKVASVALLVSLKALPRNTKPSGYGKQVVLSICRSLRQAILGNVSLFLTTTAASERCQKDSEVLSQSSIC